eukprot:scaffold29050_cov112-Isochrysis_galbana.AAC.3
MRSGLQVCQPQHTGLELGSRAEPECARVAQPVWPERTTSAPARSPNLEFTNGASCAGATEYANADGSPWANATQKQPARPPKC